MPQREGTWIQVHGKSNDGSSELVELELQCVVVVESHNGGEDVLCITESHFVAVALRAIKQIKGSQEGLELTKSHGASLGLFQLKVGAWVGPQESSVIFCCRMIWAFSVICISI